MFYIVGNEFIFNPHQNHATKSIQEQMTISKRSLTPFQKSNNIFDSKFINGHKYKIQYIQKIFINDTIAKIKYTFKDETDLNNEEINILFDSTITGDEYIAAMSGATNQLQKDRSLIQNLVNI